MKIAYGVSSVGLGHARRSLTLARKLRKEIDVDITWFAAEPVISFLELEGEKVSPACKEFHSLSSVMEDGVSFGRLDDMSRVARKSSSIAKMNYSILKSCNLSNYEALIQDEFAETMFSFMWDRNPSLPRNRIVMTDYLEFTSGRNLNPASRLVTWYANRMLSKAYNSATVRIFADEIDSVKPKQRKILERFLVAGPILPDPPTESKIVLKERIVENYFGINDANLIVVSVGGTASGKYLVDFFYENFREISIQLGCKVLILTGPRIDSSKYVTQKESPIRFVPFTTDSVDYYKAADCVVCQAGATTLNEVLQVGTPCVTLPISNHFEQQANARRFVEKFGFVALTYEAISVETLVESIKKALSQGSRSPVEFSSNVATAAKWIRESMI